MTVEKNTRAFRSIADIIYSGFHLSSIPQFFAPDYTEHADLPPEWPEGIEAVYRWITELGLAFPDLSATLENIVGQGDFVAARLSCRGTHLGSFMGIPATGRAVIWTESHFGRMEDGRLVEHWMDVDRLGLLQQMGVVPHTLGNAPVDMLVRIPSTTI